MLKFFKGRSVDYIIKHVAVSPLVLLVWLSIEIMNLFRPVFIVRLSYKGRITQYMVPMELHLRNANQLNRKYLMIFVMPAATPNEAVRNVYRRYSIIVDYRFLNFIRRTFSILSVLLENRFTPELPNWHHLWQLKPATTLIDDEVKFGEKLLQELGIPKDAPYVCLGVKESAYYMSIKKDRGYGQDLRHEASDSKNLVIDRYLEAATQLANRGIYVVRMGSVVNAPLPEQRHPKIIDYASTNRSELGDIVLGANCKFGLVACCGFWIFLSFQNKPITFCDQYEFGFKDDILSLGTKTIFLIRLLRDKKSKNLVPFFKMARGGRNWSSDDFLMRLGLEPVQNTSEEIFNAAIEMNDWIDGKLKLSEHGEDLQERFYRCYPDESRLKKNSLTKISPTFLQKYQELL
jgi:putative glycosyltransferase (TIGR04372 family)